MRNKRILVVDDEPGHRLMVKAVLEDGGWDVFEADSGEEGLKKIEQEHFPVVLLDMRMPGMDGLEVLKRLQATDSHPVVILFTAYGSVSSAVEAMKIGAFDYLTKPADNDELITVAHKAYLYSQLLAENQSLRSKLHEQEEQTKLIGQSEAVRTLQTMIDQAAPSEATILITGESGTGKELVAKCLHERSHRKNGPLVMVNCASLPGELLESELFGYEKGAFTGANKNKPGRFQLAGGGTLFLDEIGDLPLSLQPKLLRALQENEVEPLGSLKPVKTDVRIIAATNKDLHEEVQNDAFRQDLYYRLNVLELHIPPLRDRKDDIPLLVSHLLEKLSKKNKKEVKGVSPGFLQALSGYSWPGNVRELENILERALIISRSETLDVDTLPPQLSLSAPPETSRPGTGANLPDASLEDAEKQAIIHALSANEGHREKTANALGISRRTLQYKLKKYGLTRRSS